MTIGSSVKEVNINGDNCLLLAAFNGHVLLVEKIVACGVPLDSRNEEGLLRYKRGLYYYIKEGSITI